ncbi:hypothetical protein LshimejAT787_0702070 [Lyophyllum shimeji]|uniref:G domain-containing protein n=1 Tax=Lyophyllum shimeji TaxID=47721 RepID=A0A9P3PNJ3_LYOSH|nr:hypothetical protein LshimejAT787_0702070 [Lyophyllum shimeji]
MEESSPVSTSVSTIRSSRHLPDPLPGHLIPITSVSAPSSPRSSALPSPPDSPSSDSVSSLPSVSSSFFFSSAAASPPHSQPESEHQRARDSTQGLVIPSLTLPAALRRPTPYGQTIGDLRILVLGSKEAGKSFVSGLLLEDNEDVVEVGTWEEADYGRVIRASTDWIEHRDAHGLEKFEPTRNIEIIELSGYDPTGCNVETLLQNWQSIIQTPFYTVSDVLDPAHEPSAVLAGLVSSASTPLYTALVFLLPSPPTAWDNLILDTLGAHIPIIVLPRPSPNSRLSPRAKLSSFRPSSTIALRSGLFHSPETIAVLRCEATDRFLRWREVERTVVEIHVFRQNHASHRHRDADGLPWDKAKWEAEWVASLSQEVATRLGDGTRTERNMDCQSNPNKRVIAHDSSRSCLSNSHYDPLHLPSLVMFSVSLLGPLRSRFRRSLERLIQTVGDPIRKRPGFYIHSTAPNRLHLHTAMTKAPKKGKNWKKEELRPSDVFLTDTRDTDVVIPIMGATGAGKSTFINKLFGKDVAKVGHDLQSETAQVQHYILQHPRHPDRRLIIVDTPGFDDTSEDDREILRRISVWLARSYDADMTLAGVIYLYEITQTRMLGTARKNLDMFNKLCGPNAARNIILATTKWSEVTTDVGLRREKQLKDEHWRDMIKHGSRTCRFNATRESAWEIVNQILDHRAIDASQIQEELVVIDKFLEETDAGRTLRFTLKDLLEIQKKTAAQLREAEGSGQDLQQQLLENEEKIRKTLKQIKSLNVSFSKKFARFFRFF